MEVCTVLKKNRFTHEQRKVGSIFYLMLVMTRIDDGKLNLNVNFVRFVTLLISIKSTDICQLSRMSLQMIFLRYLPYR